MLLDLYRAYVTLPADDWLDPGIEFDPSMNHFNGCIGAIDGTLIDAFIEDKSQ
jgi:hypothetical protein